jgi:hypothetical protein
MRVALLGWDLDVALASALSRLQIDVVGFSRWFPGQPDREDCGGWYHERFPHALDGGPVPQSWSFCEAVLARGPSGSGPSSGFDVVHALDPMVGPAAEALAERSPGSILVGSVSTRDISPSADPKWSMNAKRWIADHPETADFWECRAGKSGTVCTVLPTWHAPAVANASSAKPLLVFWVPHAVNVVPSVVASAVLSARTRFPGLEVAVLGSGLEASKLLGRIKAMGLAVRSPCLSTGLDNPMQLPWVEWLSQASAFGVSGPEVSNDPAARLAWESRVPVFAYLASSSDLSDAIVDALDPAGWAGLAVAAGAALAGRRRTPDTVAEAILEVYLDARHELRIETESPPSTPRLLGTERTRLNLIALGAGEAYASWYLRPDDWSVALAWIGSDGPRAVLTLRLRDITDLEFRGHNAHASWDIELAYGESFRSIRLDQGGRSLVATLGVRSQQGYFHALAHAGPVHLPRDGVAPEGSLRRLQVLPRST